MPPLVLAGGLGIGEEFTPRSIASLSPLVDISVELAGDLRATRNDMCLAVLGLQSPVSSQQPDAVTALPWEECHLSIDRLRTRLCVSALVLYVRVFVYCDVVTLHVFRSQ